MKLELANGIAARKVTVDVIKKAFKDDHSRGEFIILEDEKGRFIQAAGDNRGPFRVDYRENGKNFRCEKTLSKEQTEKLFIKYLNSDLSWKEDYLWKEYQINNKGNYIVILLFVLFITFSLGYAFVAPYYQDVKLRNPDNSTFQNIKELVNSEEADSDKNIVQEKEIIPEKDIFESGTYILKGSYELDQGMFTPTVFTNEMKLTVDDSGSFTGSIYQKKVNKSSNETVTETISFEFEGQLGEYDAARVPVSYDRKINSSTVKPYDRTFDSEAYVGVEWYEETFQFTWDIVSKYSEDGFIHMGRFALEGEE